MVNAAKSLTSTLSSDHDLLTTPAAPTATTTVEVVVVAFMLAVTVDVRPVFRGIRD